MLPILPPPRLLPLLQKMKETYILWYSYLLTLPKTHRYSLGQRIDTFCIETIEAIAIASFLSPAEKQPYVRLAIRKVDTVKILLMILWETKSLDNKKYLALSVKIDEVGRMLGGWKKGLETKLSPHNGREKQ